MTRFHAIIPILFFAVACTRIQPVSPDSPATPTEDVQDLTVAEETVVKFSAEYADRMDGTPGLRRLFPDAGEFEERHRAAGLHQWFVVTEDPVTKAGIPIQDLPGVELVEKSPSAEPCATGIPFNDPRGRGTQWHLYNDGTILGKFKKGADINVVPVWEKFTSGKRDVIVAVIDTGVDSSHPDLNGIVVPDGPNGSRNFINDYSSNPYVTKPDDNHASNVASIIAAINNNGVGGCGIAGGSDGHGGVRILSCQTIASGHSGNSPEALVWAADHGAVIANNSWSYTYDSEAQVPSTPNQAIRTAIDYFIKNAGFDARGNQSGPMAGGILFFAAGNKGWSRSQPAMYDRVIAVGAMGPAFERADYSNWGDWVDLCAPGGNKNAYGDNLAMIYGCGKNGAYTYMQGTSQACPMVAGVAALLVSHFGGEGFTNSQLKDLLMNGANTSVTKYQDKPIGPLVDAWNSFTYEDSPPPQVEDFSVYSGDGSIYFNWKVQYHGTNVVQTYYAAVSHNRDDIASFDPENVPESVTVLTVDTSGKTAGSVQNRPIYHLDTQGVYYCTMVSRAKNGQYSTPETILAVKMGGNTDPEIKMQSEPPYIVNCRQTLKLLCKVSDPDGDKVEVTTYDDETTAKWTKLSDDSYELELYGDPKQAGLHSTTISAEDGFGGNAELTIEYTIRPNIPPVASQRLQDMVIGESESISIVLDDYFSDENGDELSYKADSSTNFTTASVSGNTLTVKGGGAGVSEITVYASDGLASCKQSFFVLSQDGACRLSPNPVKSDLYISCRTPGTVDVTVRDILGRTVLTKTWSATPFYTDHVDMSGLVPGVYAVIVATAEGTEKTNVVKI